jgi:hypothetical protein
MAQNAKTQISVQVFFTFTKQLSTLRVTWQWQKMVGLEFGPQFLHCQIQS